jgi:hypothetical protein
MSWDEIRRSAIQDAAIRVLSDPASNPALVEAAEHALSTQETSLEQQAATLPGWFATALLHLFRALEQDRPSRVVPEEWPTFVESP